MLKDTFDRRFPYLRLSVTDVCNFRCQYCLPNGYQKTSSEAELSLAEITQLVQVFAQLGTRKVRLTGGEPSTRSDLIQIIDAVSKTPGIEQVALTTNGYRLKESIDAWRAAGLSQLNVSIDSLDPRQFTAITGHNRLQEILCGIDHALDGGFPSIKINAVWFESSGVAELERFKEWLKNRPLTLRFIEFMQTQQENPLHARQHGRLDDVHQHLLDTGWTAIEKHATDGPAITFSHPNYLGRIGLIMPYSDDFCASCNRLRVSSRGKLHLCLFGDRGYDLRSYLQNPSDHSPSDLALSDLALSESALLALKAAIQSALADKKVTHGLHHNEYGITTNLAMLGG